MKRCWLTGILFGIISCVWASVGLAEEGFVRAVFTGTEIDTTSSIWDAEDATVVTKLDDFLYTNSYDFPEHTTYAYGTYMYFEANVGYTFKSQLDDKVCIVLDGTELVNDGKNVKIGFGYDHAGYHKIELRFFNNGGSGGGTAAVFSTDGGSTFVQFSTAYGTFTTVAPSEYVAEQPSYTIVHSNETSRDYYVPGSAVSGDIVIPAGATVKKKKRL